MKPIRIAITTGDIDGIGTEVATKALYKIKPQRNVFFYFWRSSRCPEKHLKYLKSAFDCVTVSSWPEALEKGHENHKTIIDICSNESPADWVETSAEAGVFGHIDGLVTGPISKVLIKSTGIKDIGHTEILKRITKSKEVFMAFLGEKFNVLLVTSHVPLSKITENLTGKRLELALMMAEHLKTILPKKQAKRPIALVGLNPHAGEEGIIGETEKKVYKPVLDRLIEQGIDIRGPLVPDIAFFKENWDKYSVYVSPYHDQGLIPFKMVHHDISGVHITLGLPFIRTSVDHGTAKNIFNKNKANPNSMVDAINLCIHLSKDRDKIQNLMATPGSSTT